MEGVWTSVEILFFWLFYVYVWFTDCLNFIPSKSLVCMHPSGIRGCLTSCLHWRDEMPCGYSWKKSGEHSQLSPHSISFLPFQDDVRQSPMPEGRRVESNSRESHLPCQHDVKRSLMPEGCMLTNGWWFQQGLQVLTESLYKTSDIFFSNKTLEVFRFLHEVLTNRAQILTASGRPSWVFVFTRAHHWKHHQEKAEDTYNHITFTVVVALPDLHMEPPPSEDKVEQLSCTQSLFGSIVHSIPVKCEAK